MDHKYIWRPEEYDTLTGGVLVSTVELVPENILGDNVTVDRHPHSTLHSSGQKFIRQERHAHGLTSFVTVNQKNTFLVVRNLRDRLVLTLPQDRHELGVTRFFIALAARNTSGPTLGMIFFRQDQLHIDLFVFFSVFFSCFFLFLAACVVGWKAKQAADLRRARRRHVVEMLHMAKRPFASATVLLEGNPPYLPAVSAPVPSSAGQGQGQGQGQSAGLGPALGLG